VKTKSDTDDHITISFKDQGIGIAQEHQDKVFQEYFRTNESVAQHSDGTGLGLSIAKQIIDLHAYSIKVISAPGEGCCFIVRAALLK